MSINQVTFSAHQKFVKRQPSKADIKPAEDDKPIEETLDPVERTVVSSIAPARRVIGIPDMIKQGDTAAAIGLAALTVVSLPEDCRDIKAAYKHSACVLTKSVSLLLITIENTNMIFRFSEELYFMKQ